MEPEITGFFHEPTNTVSYVVADPETGGLRGRSTACSTTTTDAGPHRHGPRRPDRSRTSAPTG